MVFARKMPEFYVIIVQKIYFPGFWGARATPSPVSYAYVESESPPVGYTGKVPVKGLRDKAPRSWWSFVIKSHL